MSADRRYDLIGNQVWPTLFFTRRWEAMPTEGRPLIDFLTRLQRDQQERIASGIAVGAKPERGLYESDFELFSKPEASLQRLVHFIQQSLANVVCIANGQQAQAQPQDVQIEFSDSWYHITSDGGFHDAHVHHGCSWCGIFYLQIGASGSNRSGAAPNGGSRFYCPWNFGGGYQDFGNKYLMSSIDPPLEDGLLLLFPSYLMHSGLPYRGDVDRIVLAFNARAFLKEGSPSADRIAGDR